MEYYECGGERWTMLEDSGFVRIISNYQVVIHVTERKIETVCVFL